MIAVRIGGYPGLAQLPVSDTTTVSEAVADLKSKYKLHFKGDTYTLQETLTGRIMAPQEHVRDEQGYYLTAWLERA